uniref:Uncharacterized protein n=1 Tax=Oryza sativa subsp. japonica TaxID=39947 RepID=Q6K605_ORYSJ|nr:hypothetical protein [Oryza sativa Japonica Group]
MAELHPDLFHVNLSSFPVIDLEVATEEGDASMSIHPRSQPSTSRLWLWWPRGSPGRTFGSQREELVARIYGHHALSAKEEDEAAEGI